MSGTASIPMDLVRRRDVSAAAKLLYGVLARHARGGEVRRAIEDLATEIGEPRRSVERWLHELVTSGVITRARTGRACAYVLGYATFGASRPATSGVSDAPVLAHRDPPLSAHREARSATSGVSDAPVLADQEGRSATFGASDPPLSAHRENLAPLTKNLSPSERVSDAPAHIRVCANPGSEPTGDLATTLLESFGRRYQEATRRTWPRSASERLVGLVIDSLSDSADPAGEIERGLDGYFTWCAETARRPAFDWDLARDFSRWLTATSLPVDGSSRHERKALVNKLLARSSSAPLTTGDVR